MAKSNNPPPPGGRSKIRLFFVDADLAPGDMEQLTNALSNAIRPTHLITKVPAAPRIGSGAAATASQDEMEEAELIDDNDEGENGDELEEQGTVAKAAPRVRSVKKVTPVDSLDQNAGGKSFKEFAAEKGNPIETTSRFLVVAYWLSEYAKISEISVDHVYTCYKFANWTFKLPDPGQFFRNFKKDGLGSNKKGLFSINQIGRARVEEMKGSAAS